MTETYQASSLFEMTGTLRSPGMGKAKRADQLTIFDSEECPEKTGHFLFL
jgi:hypothetical protein